MKKFTKAAFLSDPKVKTPVFVCFRLWPESVDRRTDLVREKGVSRLSTFAERLDNRRADNSQAA
jgi:hypothetical protein